GRQFLRRRAAFLGPRCRSPHRNGEGESSREIQDRPGTGDFDLVSENPGPFERMRRQVVVAIAWLMLIAAVVVGVIVLGRWSLGQLKTDDRFQIALTEIDCETPTGMSRTDFFGEVRYLARLPERMPVADVE